MRFFIKDRVQILYLQPCWWVGIAVSAPCRSPVCLGRGPGLQQNKTLTLTLTLTLTGSPPTCRLGFLQH